MIITCLDNVEEVQLKKNKEDPNQSLFMGEWSGGGRGSHVSSRILKREPLEIKGKFLTGFFS